MNKKQLIFELAKRTELTAADSEKLLNTFVTIFKDQIIKGQNVKLVGFGTFYPFTTKKRKAHNPATGGPMIIESHITAKFKAHPSFKATLNKETNT